MFHVLQDLIIGNKEKNQVFGRRLLHTITIISLFVMQNPTKSLETKWGVIKHNVTKFCYNYEAMAILNKSCEFFENTLQTALELFKAKHPKQGLFIFIHYWLILKYVPRWAKTREENRI